MIIRYGLPIVAAGALLFAILQMVKAQQVPPVAVPPVEPAKSPYAKQLAGAGIIESESENIAVGSHVAGVVERVRVKVGQTVKAGDPLFQLDDRHVMADVQYREAALAAAEAAEKKLALMPRAEELPPARAKVAEYDANLSDQLKMFERLKPLEGSSSISDDELTRRRLAVAMAQSQLAKAKSDLALLEAGAWEPDKLIAAAATRQARAQVTQARTELSRLTVNAPKGESPDATYKVLQVNVRPGEFVGTVPGQALVVLGCVGKLHVRVDIDENDILRFAPDLPGVAKPRGNPGMEFPISFVRIEPYVIPKRSLTGANTERVDTRVLQVVYVIDTKGKPLYVGQQMDVFLNAGAEK